MVLLEPLVSGRASKLVADPREGSVSEVAVGLLGGEVNAVAEEGSEFLEIMEVAAAASGPDAPGGAGVMGEDVRGRGRVAASGEEAPGVGREL